MGRTTGEGSSPPQREPADVAAERGERLPPREVLSLLVPDGSLLPGAAAGDLTSLTGSESTTGTPTSQAGPAFVEGAQSTAAQYVDAEASESSDTSAVEGDRSEQFTSSDSAQAES